MRGRIFCIESRCLVDVRLVRDGTSVEWSQKGFWECRDCSEWVRDRTWEDCGSDPLLG